MLHPWRGPGHLTLLQVELSLQQLQVELGAAVLAPWDALQPGWVLPWPSSLSCPPSLQMSPPPSGFSERGSGGGGGGPLSHFCSGSPTSYFASGLQAGLKQSQLSKVRGPSSRTPNVRAPAAGLSPQD